MGSPHALFKLSQLTEATLIKFWMTNGSKRVYRWLPKTADDTSNPLPTLPCATQCTNWARLCARRRPSFMSPLQGLKFTSLDDNAADGITERCTRSAEVSEVINAAEDPRPVLWTSESETPVGLNGGILSRDLIVRESPSDSSLRFWSEDQNKSYGFFRESQIQTLARWE